MTARIFQQLNEEAKKEGIGSPKKRDARYWFRQKAKAVSDINTGQMFLDKKNVRDVLGPRSIGKMYLFFYNAKHAATLPYWDKFPMVFPLAFYRDGFLGINLHYLPPDLRANLMDALYSLLNNKKMDGTTRLRISYGILKSAGQFKLFRPCVKKYLYSQMASRYLLIPPEDWDKCLLLPLERFQKRTRRYVWNRSRDMI